MSDSHEHPAGDRIEIRGLRVFGYHGVLDSEKSDGQDFVIDVVLDVDLAIPARSDALADTVDYGTLAHRLADAVADTRFDLIERLAGHLLDLILADPMVRSATVRVAKPDVPVRVALDHVAVQLRRGR